MAFFDHDDVLEPAALEIMVRAQAATGARLLYSDEDKIDASGGLSEPHFKPDFDDRLLLELNYICHLVLVEAELAQSLRLDSAYDGAQDHDFLLRASEVLAAPEIHHVPEVLYHWRKTAGLHVGRWRGEAARGVSRGGGGGGAFAAAAATGDRPAKVTILIPFRDRTDMTRSCVVAIRRHTRGVAYEIVLLDNGSASEETENFLQSKRIFRTRGSCGLPSRSIMRGLIISGRNYLTKNFCYF